MEPIDNSVANRQDASEHREEWLTFFDSIAQQVVSHIQPHIVLGIGYNISHLVKALRQRDVDAFGLEISADVVQNIPDVQSHCWVGSVTDLLPQQYDLIICIEALKHLSSSEAKRAVENFCQYSHDVLFATLPDHSTMGPDYWAELFARHSFFRDVDFNVSPSPLWVARFHRKDKVITQVVATYERRLWQLERENWAYHKLSVEQRNELTKKEETLLALEARLARFEGSMGWTLLQKLQYWRARLAPPGSVRDQALEDVFRALQTGKGHVLIEAMRRLGQEFYRQAKSLLWRVWLRINPPRRGQVIQVGEILARPPVQPHQSTVEIIICIHNALADVQRCLESVERHTAAPYSLILVDDGSDSLTRDYLAELAQERPVILLRNEVPQGYTKAANQGLRHTSADYVVLLNSDTVVTAGWLDRLIACAKSNPQIGLVGPLSNAASWQSIPEVDSEGDWVTNSLPPGITIDEMGQLMAHYSARLYPPIPFLNGFCLMIRRQVMDEIGLFDEENFGTGYGEEDDYILRARKVGWRLALADDTYIYHAQSRSYTHERRKRLSERASVLLAKKHGSGIIRQGVVVCREDRVLAGIRARSRVMFDRREWIRKGQEKFKGRRILFVLPILGVGGGANVVINEALAMREMGVDAQIFNLTYYRDRFEQAYPKLEVPVIYGEKEDLVTLGSGYDAIIATANFTVEWLTSVNCLVRGYYVQGFEPYIYTPGTEDFHRAEASYTLLPDLVRFTKTEWTRQEVREKIGVECTSVGVSLNIDLFRPRPRSDREEADQVLRIVAMVRPGFFSWRKPKLTMELLRRASRRYGSGVEIVIFGISLDDPRFADLPHNFAWKLAGVLTEKQVAYLLNEADIFVDFSSHQAMGLTALEAMACGATVIVPERGGAISFARHKENSLVVDTSSPEACWQALQRLIEDHHLRSHLQRNALVDVCDFFPERPAFNILRTLFEPEDGNSL